MSLKTFESGGKTYQIDRLDIFDQVHIVRKLMPILASGLDSPLLEGIKSLDDLQNFGIAMLLRSMAVPFSQALARMDKADAEYVMKSCLNVCKRKEESGWASLLAPNGTMMYQDIELMDIFRIVSEVVKTNLKSFFAIAQQNSSEVTPA